MSDSQIRGRVEFGAYTVVWENDVGPNDDGYWEWWQVEHGDNVLCKCDKYENAVMIARSIASYPNMLDALKVASAWFDSQGDHDDHAEKVRSALALAK